MQKLSGAGTAEVSLSCGLSSQIVTLGYDEFSFKNVTLPLPDLSASLTERTILIWKNGEWQKWQRFDEQTNNFYKMIFVAEGKPPTVEISGIKMHVTMDGDPELDTRRKLKELGRIQGNVLDVCCGLGYTAQALAKFDDVVQVTIFERDANMLALCRENPWSAGLWANNKIQIVKQNASEGIKELPDNHFA
ncbi:MAG: methyltransferase, partial [Calditrichota bacterium]